MDLVGLRARSTFLADLEFVELGRLTGKIGSRAAWSSAKHPLRWRCWQMCGNVADITIILWPVSVLV